MKFLGGKLALRAYVAGALLQIVIAVVNLIWNFNYNFWTATKGHSLAIEEFQWAYSTSKTISPLDWTNPNFQRSVRNLSGFRSWRARDLSLRLRDIRLWPTRQDYGSGSMLLALPMWLPLAFLLAASSLAFWARQRRAMATGRCIRCGYDLRGNVSGKCPECGLGVPIIPPIPAGEMFGRRRRTVLRRRRFRLCNRRFAAVRRWSYTVGAVGLALWWVLSYIWATDRVSYEGDLVTDQSLSVLVVSIEKGRLDAVVDNLYSAKVVSIPESLPASGWHMRRAGMSSTESVHAFRGRLDRAITHSTFDLLGFPLWVPFLALALLAGRRWWRNQWRISRERGDLHPDRFG